MSQEKAMSQDFSELALGLEGVTIVPSTELAATGSARTPQLRKDMYFMEATSKDTGTGPEIPLGLSGTEIDLYVAYHNLGSPEQRVFEDLLLEHVLFRTHLDVYISHRKSANDLREKIGRELSWTTSDWMAHTWFVWAGEMSKNKRPVEFLDHSIFELLGHVVRARLAEQHAQLGTGAGRPVGSAFSRFGIRIVGSGLPQVYAKLASHHRHAVEDSLLSHVFLPHGVDAYGGTGRWSSLERDWWYHRLEEFAPRLAAKAWKKWSAGVAQKSLSPNECRNEVLMMLKSLIAVKLAEKQLLDDVKNGRGSGSQSS